MAEMGCEESLGNIQCCFIQPSRVSVQDGKTQRLGSGEGGHKGMLRGRPDKSPCCLMIPCAQSSFDLSSWHLDS